MKLLVHTLFARGPAGYELYLREAPAAYETPWIREWCRCQAAAGAKKGNYCCNNNWPISTKQLEVHHMCTFFLVFLDSKCDTFWTIFIDPRKGHFGSALMNDKFLTGSTLYTYMWIVLFELLRSEKVVITYKCCFACYHVSCENGWKLLQLLLL